MFESQVLRYKPLYI